MYEWLHVRLCNVCAVPTDARRGHQIPRNWSYIFLTGNQAPALCQRYLRSSFTKRKHSWQFEVSLLLGRLPITVTRLWVKEREKGEGWNPVVPFEDTSAMMLEATPSCSTMSQSLQDRIQPLTLIQDPNPKFSKILYLTTFLVSLELWGFFYITIDLGYRFKGFFHKQSYRMQMLIAHIIMLHNYSI